MSSPAVHPDRLDELRNLIAAGKLVVVVGAGVSIGATMQKDGTPNPYASWTGLVEAGIAEMQTRRIDPDLVKAAQTYLKRGELEIVADQIIDNLGLGYGEWLHKCLSNEAIPLTNDEVPRALGRLGLPLFTTNYDFVLERATGRHALTWRNGPGWKYVKEDPTSYVMHLHGTADDAESVVFGRRDYDSLLRHLQSQALLTSLATEFSLLFVGVGGTLDDANFTRLRRYLGGVLGSAGREHFRLVRRGEKADEPLASNLIKERITEIEYGDSLTELAVWLQQLAPPEDESRGGRAVPSAILTVEVDPNKVSATLTGATATNAGEAYRALLVGIWQYEDPGLVTLKGPPNDLDLVASTLAEAGAPSGRDWEVARCPERGSDEPNRDELGARLRNFFLKAREEDTLLFYYSGHGTIANGDSYLCTGRTKLRDPSLESIAAREIALWIKQSRAKGIVVVLDCCRGATLNANAYDELGDNVAVVLASKGLAQDAESDTDPSPFTTKLVDVLRDTLTGRGANLTVGDLVSALERQGVKPGTNARLGKDIPLTRRPIASIASAPAKARDAIEFGVNAGCVDAEKLPLVRQLADVLDGLLAAGQEPEQVPSELVTQTMQMLARELHAGLTPEDQQMLDQALCAKTPSTCAVRFSDSAALSQLGDLPWEYLALHLYPQQGEQDLQAVLRSPPIFVERLVDVSQPTKGDGTTMQKVELFSSLRRTDERSPHPLTAATKRQLEDLRINMAAGDAASWNVFSMAQDDADVVILQCPVRLAGRRLEMLFAPGEGYEAVPAQQETLAKKLNDRSSMTTLLIETIADDSGHQSALAVRRLARGLAESVRCPVVAICHSRAYSTCLKDYPNEPVFLPSLLKAIRSRQSLDQAAHTARNEVVTSLPTEPTIVGIPIVVRPDVREEQPEGRDEHRTRPRAVPRTG